MATPCYSGPNPITDDERIGIWKWAKVNGIDQGMSFEKVGDAINQRFYNGVARPEWITDVLSGRKTPFRQQADAAWRAQYNRDVIVRQARDISRLQGIGPIGRAISKIWSAPRSLAVTGHSFVFPMSHAGDLIMRPRSWATFFTGTANLYRGAYDKAFVSRMLTDMQSRSLYETSLRSGLDVGPKSAPSGLLGGHNEPLAKIFGSSHQAWDMLTVMRYQLWEKQMQKFIKPGMSQAEILDIGKNLASWANHATGSGKGPIASIPGAGNWLFGPKLTQSKLNRVIGDPIQTVRTFANWDAATSGQKAAALTRLSGAAQYAATYLGFLAVNQGLNMALKSGQNVNFTDPTKGDWLKFKIGGLEGGIPGLHTELRTLGQILATAYVGYTNPKQLRGASVADKMGTILERYGTGKLSPSAQLGKEVLTGQDWLGRPVPWSPQPGTPSKPRLDALRYLVDKLPIPMAGPLGYFYDKMKQNGSSALDATTIIKGLVIAGLGGTGLHAQEESPPAPPRASRGHRAHR